MKGHKAEHHEKHAHHMRKHKKAGGEIAHDKAPKEVYEGAGSHVVHEAEQRKAGGRAKRKHGGHTMHHTHHEHGKHLAHAKHVGHVHGEHAKHHAGRKPRKSGGRLAGTEWMAAQHGTPPKGHKEEMN